jgi:hypothetical protein
VKQSGGQAAFDTPLGTSGDVLGFAIVNILIDKIELKLTTGQVEHLQRERYDLYHSQNPATARLWPRTWRQLKAILGMPEFFAQAFIVVHFCPTCARPFPFKGEHQCAPPDTGQRCSCGGYRYLPGRLPKAVAAYETWYLTFECYAHMHMNDARFVRNVQEWHETIRDEMTASTPSAPSYYGSWHMKSMIGHNQDALAQQVLDNPWCFYLILLDDGIAVFDHNTIQHTMSMHISGVRNLSAGKHFAQTAGACKPIRFGIREPARAGLPPDAVQHQIGVLADMLRPDRVAVTFSAPLGRAVPCSAIVTNVQADGPAMNDLQGTKSTTGTVGGNCPWIRGVGHAVEGKAGSKRKRQTDPLVAGKKTRKTTKYLAGYGDVGKWSMITGAEMSAALGEIAAAEQGEKQDDLCLLHKRRCATYIFNGDSGSTAYGPDGLAPYPLHLPLSFGISGLFHQSATAYRLIFDAMIKLKGVSGAVDLRMSRLREATPLCSYGNVASAYKRMSCETLHEYFMFLVPVTWLPALRDNGHEDWWEMLAALHATMLLCNSGAVHIEMQPLMVALARQHMALKQVLLGEQSMTYASFYPILAILSAFLHGSMSGHCELCIDEIGRTYVKGIAKGRVGNIMMHVVEQAAEVRFLAALVALCESHIKPFESFTVQIVLLTLCCANANPSLCKPPAPLACTRTVYAPAVSSQDARRQARDRLHRAGASPAVASAAGDYRGAVHHHRRGHHRRRHGTGLVGTAAGSTGRSQVTRAAGPRAHAQGRASGVVVMCNPARWIAHPLRSQLAHKHQACDFTCVRL